MGYKEDVAKAVNDEEWQKFRLSLKGVSTEEKLKRLREYYDDTMKIWEDATRFKYERTEYEARMLRLYNYLTAIARGGQIATSLDYLGDLAGEKLVIQK